MVRAIAWQQTSMLQCSVWSGLLHGDRQEYSNVLHGQGYCTVIDKCATMFCMVIDKYAAMFYLVRAIAW